MVMMTAKETHLQLGAALLGVMSTLANAMEPLTLVFQIISLLPSMDQNCITRMQHVALQMATRARSVLQSQMKPYAMLRTSALSREAHVVLTRLV
jgi:hypothetical protein